MENKYSETELIHFMDWLANKGLLNPTTARSRKIAASKVLGALDDNEKLDLRAIDREQTFQRFSNKSSKDFTPDSLTTYKSRFNSALDDFIRWVENPAGFKTGLSQKGLKSKASDGSSKTKSKGIKPPPPSKHHDQQMQRDQGDPPSVTFPIPIRSGVIIEIRNLPMDLTPSEADRIGAVVKALAV